MDLAVADPEFKTKPFQLDAINACRIYHGVVYFSDMSTYTGRHMIQEYLWGRRSMRKIGQGDWPTQPVPVTRQWRVWRQFLRKHHKDSECTWKNPVNPTKRIQLQPRENFKHQFNVTIPNCRTSFDECLQAFLPILAKFFN